MKKHRRIYAPTILGMMVFVAVFLIQDMNHAVGQAEDGHAYQGHFFKDRAGLIYKGSGE